MGFEEDEEMDFTIPLRRRREDYWGQADDLRQQYNDKLALASSVPELSSSQKVFSGILPLASMFIGAAMAGNKGGAFGAQAGLGSSAEFEKSALATEQNRNVAAAREASRLYDEIKTNEARGFQVDRSDAQDARMRDYYEFQQRIKRDNRPNSDWSDEEAMLLGRLSSGETLSREEEAILARNKDLAKEASSRRRAVDTQARADRKWDAAIQEREIPGLEISKGERPSERDVVESKKLYGNWQNADGLLGRLDESLTDPEATLADQNQILSRVIVKMKAMDEMGANFTEMEAMLQKNQLPALYAASPSHVLYALRKEMEGQDPRKMVDSLRKQLRSEMEVGIGLRHYNISTPKYSEDELRAAQYTDDDIEALRAQGRVR
jgi:hypothetical protein